MYAVAVFIDLRGFTPLTTLLQPHEVSEVLSIFQSEWFDPYTDIANTGEGNEIGRGEWRSGSIGRFVAARKKVVKDLYCVQINDPISMRFGRWHVTEATSQSKVFPLAAFHKFLGDGILFVFETGSPMEVGDLVNARKYAKVNYISDHDFYKLNNQAYDSRYFLQNVLGWATELSRWVPRESLDEKYRALGALKRIRIGIGVSFGIVNRRVQNDPYAKKTVIWDYVGDPVNRAARLEDLARPGGIVVDISNKFFHSELLNVWSKLADHTIATNGQVLEDPYYFAKIEPDEEVQGVGKMHLLAAGAKGRELLLASDATVKDVSYELEHFRLWHSRPPYSHSWVEQNYVRIKGQLPPAILIHTEEHPPKFVHNDKGVYQNRIKELLGPERYVQWQTMIVALKRETSSSFDGKVVRLDQLGPDGAHVSNSNYFWAAGIDYAYPKRANRSAFNMGQLVGNPFQYDTFNEKSRQFDFCKAVIGNNLGVNLLIYECTTIIDDESNSEVPAFKFILQRRSDDVLVEKNKLCSTGSGALSPSDIKLYPENPLLQGAWRETRRETGLRIINPKISNNYQYLGLTRELIRCGTPDSFFGLKVTSVQDLIDSRQSGSSEEHEWYEIDVYTVNQNNPYYVYAIQSALKSTDDPNEKNVLTEAWKAELCRNPEKFIGALATAGKICIALLHSHFTKSKTKQIVS